jgi:hypothetical protein
MQVKGLDIFGRAARTAALALALGAPLAVCLPAHAFEVTEAQKQACTPDAFRLCSAAIPDADRVAACMAANVRNLSPACRAVFRPVGAMADATPGARHHVRKMLTSYEHRHHHFAREADRSWARD